MTSNEEDLNRLAIQAQLLQRQGQALQEQLDMMQSNITDLNATISEDRDVGNAIPRRRLERSLGLLRPFGRFLELGKRDYVENRRVGLRPLRRNATYFAIDVDELPKARPAQAAGAGVEAAAGADELEAAEEVVAAAGALEAAAGVVAAESAAGVDLQAPSHVADDRRPMATAVRID